MAWSANPAVQQRERLPSALRPPSPGRPASPSAVPVRLKIHVQAMAKKAPEQLAEELVMVRWRRRCTHTLEHYHPHACTRHHAMQRLQPP